MFFILSKLLIFLLNPLLWVVVGLILGWKNMQKKSGTIFIKLSVIVLLLFSNPFLANLAIKYLEEKPITKDSLPLSDVGIVLTGMVHSNQKPTDQIHFNEAADRIVETLKLYEFDIIDKLIISGGSGELLNQEERESIKLKDFFVNNIKSKDLIIESQSRNTFENALKTKELLEKMNLSDRTIILITSAFHMKRALACFKKQELDVIAYPVDYRHKEVTPDIAWITPSSGSLSDWNLIIKEMVGLWVYQLTGKA